MVSTSETIRNSALYSLATLVLLIWTDGFRKWCDSARIPVLLNAWAVFSFVTFCFLIIWGKLSTDSDEPAPGRNPPTPAEVDPPKAPTPAKVSPPDADPKTPRVPTNQPPVLPTPPRPTCKVCGYEHPSKHH